MATPDMLQALFRQVTGTSVCASAALTPAGSDRRYYRLTGDDGATLIGVEGTSKDENEAFFAIAAQLGAKGIGVPEVKAISDDRLCYLQEDLGDTSLFSLIQQGTAGDILEKVMRSLPAIQIRGAEGFDFSRCYPAPAMDRRSILWDLNYFKYCFLKATGVEILEGPLEDDFERLADSLLSEPFDTFMYRDFQSRNIMVVDGEPRFIDFQGGRRGPIYYDVASFLWQARAGFDDATRNHLIDIYLEALQPYRAVQREAFMPKLKRFVLFRLLQVLGAYGFRGWFEHKAHFLQSMVPAIDSLRHELEGDFSDIPYLIGLLRKVVALPCFEHAPEAEGLTVDICSFSYKRGLPDDRSGNGGGFIFDCRAIHNPGRYEAYRDFTGKDSSVIDFLDATDGMGVFMKSVYTLVDQAVEVYVRRGFTHLMVSFGCTGGQHRSVYAAEHLAAHLREVFPDVHIRLTHREQAQLNNNISNKH